MQRCIDSRQCGAIMKLLLIKAMHGAAAVGCSAIAAAASASSMHGYLQTALFQAGDAANRYHVYLQSSRMSAAHAACKPEGDYVPCNKRDAESGQAAALRLLRCPLRKQTHHTKPASVSKKRSK